MKSITNLSKTFLFFNLTAFAIYLPMAYLGYYLSFGLAMILVIIGSGVSGFFLFFQIDKTFQKSSGRAILGFLSEMILTIMAWYFLYSFILLQQGKVTPLISPSSAKNYKDYTFFKLKNHEYNPQIIAYYQHIHRNKEGSPTYTNYYACPIIDQNGRKRNSILWLGYDKSGRMNNLDFFRKKTQEKHEYFAKYSIEQNNFKKAINKKVSKEIGKNSIVVYGIESPKQAKKEAWQYFIYLLLIMNILFWSLWVIISFYDKKSKSKQTT